METFELAPARGARIVVDRLVGQAPAYLFLHGLGSTRAGEKSDALLAKAEREGRGFARFDFRGHGASSGSTETTVLSDLIEDATAVLTATGPSVLVGSSLGGLVGAWTAAQNPQLVTRVLLIAPALGYVPRMLARPDPLRITLADGRVIRLHPRYLEDARRYDEERLARSLPMPVLMVHGEHDDVVPAATSAEFFARIPHSRKRLWIVPAGDHRLTRDIAAIYAALDTFTREVPVTALLEHLATPALLVRLDRVRANLARMQDLLGAHGLGRWRPHVKTAKIAAVLDLFLAAGVRRFKCATTREAQVLLERADAAGPTIDLLVAIAHRGANLRRVVELENQHPAHRVALLTEDPEHARDARGHDRRLGLFVDLDPGYRRSGIPLAERARIDATIAACAGALRGLHCYDGHVRDAAPVARERRAHQIYAEVLELAQALPQRPLEVVTSGTPTFPCALTFAGFDGAGGLDHQISPGTVVYWDTNSAGLGISGFAPAVHVLARVVSAPAPDRITVDAGSKALDAAAGDPCCAVADWPGLRALTPSEEHLPLQVTSGPAPALGTLLELVPRHVCPTVNLADHAVLLEGNHPLQVVPVAARGHETFFSQP